MRIITRQVFKVVTFAILMLAAGLHFTGCSPEGLINKTKYDGEKYVNTCDQFQEELDQVINSNSTPEKLVVAEYDNSDFDYYYLDPGQFEIKDGYLNFRFAQDLEYGKYLQKGVAVHVMAKYASLEHLANIESPTSGDVGMLIIDEEYYNDNKEPFFIYKIPITDENINGRTINLTFSVVQYKKGKIKKVFCNSVEVPLGPINPSCCDHRPWEGSATQSAVEMPELQIDDEKYRYRGFTGTLDFINPENSVVYDKELLNSAIHDYIKKYDSLGYDVTKINIEGWASMGGKEDHNMDLSERRAKTVYADLLETIQDTTLQIDYAGRGEDWNRLTMLTKVSVLSPEEQGQVMAVANGGGTLDEKEAQMRELPFWEKLVDEVIVNTRHVFVTFSFDYVTDKMWVEYYPSPLPVIKGELLNLAAKEMKISPWEKGETNEGLKVLDILIGNNSKANLFAMRSTYHFGNKNFRSAIQDIDKALSLDESNLEYQLAGLAYKTKYADSYSLQEKMDMLKMYNDYTEKYPGNRGLFFNRAVMMDKVGYISGALSEYDELLEGAEPSSSNLNNRGVAKLKTKRLTEAEADFNAAIQKDPNNAEAHFNLGIIYGVRGLSTKAVEALNNAVRINPDLKDEIRGNEAFRVMNQTPAFDQFK